jgi:phospholipase/carboxylesterase
LLTARPSPRIKPIKAGSHRVGSVDPRDGIIVIPPDCAAKSPCPLILALHGAGGNAHDALVPLRQAAEEVGIVVVAPDSRGLSWDATSAGGGAWGRDVDFIDHALVKAFDSCSIDAARVAILGFSDGASYALSLGLANGDLFTHVIAFSPGFARPPGWRGKPRVFVSHGVDDPILPPVSCSRRIVARLRANGYDVTFREFAGDHSVPADVSGEAIEWFLKSV